MRLRRENNSRVNLTGVEGEASFSWLTLTWYVLGAIVLGVLLAKWSWILLKAPATVTAIVPEHNVSADAGKLFGVVAAGSPAAATILPDVELVGVFAPDAGQSGFAVLRLDQKRQVGVVAGGNIAPGVKLLEVHSDHVVVEHGGVRQNIRMVNAHAGAIVKGIEPAEK